MAEAVRHDKTARQLRLLSDALDSGRLGPVSEPRILPSRITPDCRLLAVADRWRGPWAPGNPSPKGLKESPLGGRDGGGHHEGAAEAQLLTIARNCLKDVPAA